MPEQSCVFASGECWFLFVSSLTEPTYRPASVDNRKYPLPLLMLITSGAVKRGCYFITTSSPQILELLFQQLKQTSLASVPCIFKKSLIVQNKCRHFSRDSPAYYVNEDGWHVYTSSSHKTRPEDPTELDWPPYNIQKRKESTKLFVIKTNSLFWNKLLVFWWLTDGWLSWISKHKNTKTIF